jgi:hypothetical protein
MKNIVLFLIFGCFAAVGYGQISDSQLNKLEASLKASGQSEEEIKATISGIVNNPDLYNTLWKYFLEQAAQGDSAKWKFLKDLNIQFKTFQATDQTPASLGFNYDLNFNYAKFKEHNKSRISHSFGLTTKGNVAFNAETNPTNFLESNVNYSFSQFIGGVVKTRDTAIFARLNQIEDKLVNIKDMHSKEALALWDEFGQNLVLSNQFYYSLAPKFGFESDQQFSKTQFTPGISLNLGIKAWNEKDLLSKLNILDYPFALLRLITATDNKFTPYGSTLPTIRFTVDYVIPQNDTVRKQLVNNLSPFPRLNFEAGFKTLVANIINENIFFSANFRYYQEIDAPAEIVNAKLDKQTYLVLAFESSKGFYFSYAHGKLPFDAKSDEVYSIGYSYKF